MADNVVAGTAVPNKNGKSGSAAGMEDNLKKALSEMMVLFLLRERDMYINEIITMLYERSEGRLNLVFPYALIYRMIDFRYIIEKEKKIAPDGRRRQYFQITEAGKVYLEELLLMYSNFSTGVQKILSSEGRDENG